MSITCTLTTSKPVHGAKKDWIVEELKRIDKSYTEVAPAGCNLNKGDLVTYVNDYGVSFDLTVKGFTEDNGNGRTVYIFNDCYWFPVYPSRCTPVVYPRPIPKPALNQRAF